MPSFKVFDIAGSGLSAQSVRLNTVASNLANAESVSGDPNTVYKARHPVFEAVKASMGAQPGTEQGNAAVRVRGIMESTSAPTARYEPGNPLAKAADKGPTFVFMEVPDINAVVLALKGSEIVQGLHDTPYGAKEVIVREPGGHFVIFSQLPQR